MTWVTPRTWATGLVVTATILNTEIRDQFLHYSTHAHDGSSGGGNDEMTGLDGIIFDDTSAPAAPGSGKTVIYAVSGKMHQRSGASGADSEFSVVGHTHPLSEAQADEQLDLHGMANPEDSGAGISGETTPTSFTTSHASSTRSTITKASADNSVVITAAGSILNATGNANHDSHMRIVSDGTQTATEEILDVDDPGANNGWAWHALQFTEDGEAAASQDYDVDFKHDLNGSSGALAVYATTLFTVEVTDA